MERDPMEMALSTDIVLDNILSHLKVEDLLACRYVSKFWNKAASTVLRKRSTMIKDISKTKTLKKLEKCLEQSSDFPFTGLIVDQPWKLSSADAMEFFKKYGASFTNLRLGTWSETSLRAPFINHLPRLSILELGHPGSCRLPELLESAAGQEDGTILKLPALHTLRISSYRGEGVLREVCGAASPSLRIECLRTSYATLKALKRAGKLKSLSILNVQQDYRWKDFELKVTEILSTESPLLSKLRYSTNSLLSLDGLQKILISSQHTLKELCLNGIYPSEFLSECPVLPKLSKLNLCTLDESDWNEHVFPDESIFQGRQGHKFPALKEMKLDTGIHPSVTIDFSDGLFVVPSLERIHIVGYVKKTGIEDLARSFPNVIEVGLIQEDYDFKRSWYTDPTDIWSVKEFKKLEKLRIWPYTIQSPTKIVDNFEEHKDFLDFKIFRMMNMDSFLTGMPIGICENLRKREQQNLKDSPFNEILRDSPNLLQLKNLKELIVCVRLEDESHELPKEFPFISMVSVRYALEMMPNLQWKFVYEHRSPAWCLDEKDENEDEAVTKLKFAFKGVQPYVELEPFFY